MRASVFFVFLLLGLVSAQQAHARPVSFPGGWMIMQMNDGSYNSLMVNYSPTAQYSVGARTDYMSEDETWMHTLNYNRLLKRWNGPDSQANIFLMTGAGVGEDHGDTAPAAFGGIEADWETRRYYTLYENRFIGSSAINESFSQRARLGIAPYIGGYNDIHTWLMVQVDHRPSERDNITITPFIRLFNQEVLGELGFSNHKDVMFNITMQF